MRIPSNALLATRGKLATATGRSKASHRAASRTQPQARGGKRRIEQLVTGPYLELFGVILVIGLLGVGLTRIGQSIENHFARWRN